MKTLLVAASVTLAFTAPLMAQNLVGAPKTEQTAVGGGGSPHVTTTWTFDGGTTIAIAYGRPSLKGRPEAQMMPAGEPWRTGADEATIITSNKPLTFGTVKLPAGTHTIYTQPGDKEWQIILGKLDKPGQWGVPYNAALELGRAPMKIGTAATPAEQVTYSIDRVGNQNVLRIEWGTKSATVPFTIGM